MGRKEHIPYVETITLLSKLVKTTITRLKTGSLPMGEIFPLQEMLNETLKEGVSVWDIKCLNNPQVIFM